MLSDYTVKGVGDENLQENESLSLLRNRKPVAQQNSTKEMIIGDDSGLIQALRYTSMAINRVSSSAIMTLISAQNTTFFVPLAHFLFIFHFPAIHQNHFVEVRKSIYSTMWFMIACRSCLSSCRGLTPFSKGL